MYEEQLGFDRAVCFTEHCGFSSPWARERMAAHLLREAVSGATVCNPRSLGLLAQPSALRAEPPAPRHGPPTPCSCRVMTLAVTLLAAC